MTTLIVCWLAVLTAAVFALAAGLCQVGAAADRESERMCRPEGER